MKNFVILFTIILFSSITAVAQSKDEVAIRNAMNLQLAAWNAGDIDRFMGTYWSDDSLMFIGKSGVTYGWQKTLENYKKGYPDTAAMGKLDFTILQAKRLSVMYFFVVGTWHLARIISDVGGAFTLLFWLVKGKWIVLVHPGS